MLLLNPSSDFERIQVLVERNEGFQGSAGVDGCSSDHSRQNLHVHDGAVEEWPKKRHLDVQENVKNVQYELTQDIKIGDYNANFWSRFLYFSCQIITVNLKSNSGFI